MFVKMEKFFKKGHKTAGNNSVLRHEDYVVMHGQETGYVVRHGQETDYVVRHGQRTG